MTRKDELTRSLDAAIHYMGAFFDGFNEYIAKQKTVNPIHIESFGIRPGGGVWANLIVGNRKVCHYDGPQPTSDPFADGRQFAARIYCEWMDEYLAAETARRERAAS
jgi:hypothetical protein